MTQTGHWSAGAAFTLIASFLAATAIAATALVLYKKRGLQPLKIRSPSLLTMFLIGNVLTILLLFLVQFNSELALTGANNDVWVGAADTAGYLLVCFSEPLIMLSYSARFIRVKRIFDAQYIYF